ncbi:MAG: tRNA-2-methylthio-N6-dimethylallyladenosine synthase [Granulosicoccus sp.]|jgi:tRNA-2-methylthio-N6-dimethylallyladenosine synthase
MLKEDSDKQVEEARQGEALELDMAGKATKKLYMESYGCAMNFSDSEVVASVLQKDGYTTTKDVAEADVIFINTCAIRDNAEQRIRGRLAQFNVIKKNKKDLIVGVMGCMAERLKEQLLEEEKIVDMVIGPDAYRDLPNLLKEAETGQKAVNVQLSLEETYADISPVRLGGNGITALVSITRGCDNMCSFCVVPFTRGRERSRNPESIVAEAQDLFDRGYREVTLLGQNVNSYLWTPTLNSKKLINKALEENGTLNGETPVTFAQLMEMVAEVDPLLRVRFSTSHPKDMGDDVLYAIAKHPNICDNIHLPVQSGNSELLEKMNRGYTREWYLNRIEAINRIIPGSGITTDIITGFCGETDEQFEDTYTLMEEVGFDFSYMYKYSERPKTKAERKYEDDISEEVKSSRLDRVIKLQRGLALKSNEADIGKTFEILVEGLSKRNDQQLAGRSSENKLTIFPKGEHKAGEYVYVKINDCTSATLFGEVVEKP